MPERAWLGVRQADPIDRRNGKDSSIDAGDSASSVRIRLGDIVVEVTAPDRLRRFICDRFPHEAGDDVAADVVSTFHGGRPDAAGRPIGRRIGRDRDGAVWCQGAPGLPDLAVRIADGDPPAVDVWHPPSRLRRVYKRIVAGVTETQRLEAVTFYTLLYPALLVAERRGRFPLHAAAVARDRRVVVIGGLPGSGKSTLSAALLRHGWDLVSDNLVLLGGGALWPFPEPLRLDEESLALARVFDRGGPLDGEAAGLDSRRRRSTHRRSAHPYDPAPGPYEVAAVVIVERGDETRLDAAVELPVETLLDLNRLALELDAYYSFRAWTRMAIQRSDVPGEAGAIGDALSHAISARMTIARGDIDEATEAIDGLFARQGPPAG